MTIVQPADTSVRSGPQTRRLILDAAARIMRTEGYAGTKLSDIADIVGVKTPAIYRHFASREELIDEVMTVGHQRFIDHVSAAIDALPDSATPLDRVLAAVGGHLEAALTMSDYAAASTRNMNQMPENIRTRQRALLREYGAIWQEHLGAAAAAGQLHPDLDPRAVQGLVIGALSWTNEWWNHERGDLDALIRNAQHLVRQGIVR